MKLKTDLLNRFKGKDMKSIHEILGIKIIRDKSSKTLKLCQKEYIERMLKRFNMEDCNGCATPCTTKLPEISNESEPDKRIPYEALVGSLLWISLGTRGDICYSVHQLSKYVKCYNNEMWTCGKRVLRYLKQTMNESLTFSSNPNSTNSELIGYSDSSFADDKSDRRSTYGYCIYYNQNCISWSSKKMDSVALSACETEFVSVATSQLLV